MTSSITMVQRTQTASSSPWVQSAMLQKKSSTILQRKAKKSDLSKYACTAHGCQRDCSKFCQRQQRKSLFLPVQRNLVHLVNRSILMLLQHSVKQDSMMLSSAADAMALVQKTHRHQVFSLSTRNSAKQNRRNALRLVSSMMLPNSAFLKLNRHRSLLPKVLWNANSGVSAVMVL